MATIEVKNLQNQVVGELSLSDEVFGAPLNEALIYDALKNYQANQRQGTSATKTRGNTSGSGKKLWKQKGTGRARVASLRSPLWKGGGNVHGPQPRDWSYELPKKMKRGALRSASGNVIVGSIFAKPASSSSSEFDSTSSLRATPPTGYPVKYQPMCLRIASTA